MKKLILTLSIAVASYSLSFAQWQNGTDIYNTNTGNVGIGTTTPGAPLHIYRASSSSSALQIFENGHASNNAAQATYVNAGGTLRVGMERSVGTGMINGFNNYSGVIATDGAYPLLLGTDGTVRMTVLPTSGNVGIGTTTPSNKFTIQADASSSGAADGVAQLLIRGNTNIYKRLAIGMDTYNNVGFIKSDNYGTAPYPLSLQPDGGNVGVGTTTPQTSLDVSNVFRIGATTTPVAPTTGAAIEQYYDGTTDRGNIYTFNRTGSSWKPLYINGSNLILNSSSGGNVGIGTESPDEKLTVKGNIHAAEVKVEALSAIPDYVFEPDYKLRSLEEIKNYVDQNHHLPEIPSAKEIEKNGIQVGDMSLKLLKTIEELTLHVIELNNKVKTQNEKITSLENQLKK